MKMPWNKQSTVVDRPEEIFMETVKELPKSITQQLQEFQIEEMNNKRIARNRKEDNNRRFTQTIRPMLDELVNFDNKFSYCFDDGGARLQYRPHGKSYSVQVGFYADEHYIINASSGDWMLTQYPPSTASELDRFVFFIKAFFGKYLTQ